MKATPRERIMSIPDQIPGLITDFILVTEYLAIEDQELHLGWFYDTDSTIWKRIGMFESVRHGMKEMLA